MHQIDDLIIKFLNDTLSPQESDRLTQWILESDANSAYFKKFIKSDYQLLKSVKSSATPHIPESFSTLIPKDKKGATHLKKFLIAACIVGLIGIASLFFISNPLSQEVPDFKINAVQIQLEDGSTKSIEAFSLPEAQANSMELDEQKKQLEYQQTKPETQEQPVFHKIIVPPGRRFSVKLSDGTLVYLNAGSTLKYPKQFSRLDPRRVSLEGEAYFEVSHDSLQPFVVSTDALNIKVLGTKFNHSSYSNDSIAKTSLVEGKVAVWKTKDSIDPYILKAMEALIYNQNTQSLVKSTVDISLDLAWMDNRLIFRGAPFTEISKKIERYYGVKINNRFSALNNVRFSGEFNIEEESIIDVLQTFQLSKPFTYHITDNEIFITKTQ